MRKAATRPVRLARAAPTPEGDHSSGASSSNPSARSRKDFSGADSDASDNVALARESESGKLARSSVVPMDQRPAESTSCEEGTVAATCSRPLTPSSLWGARASWSTCALAETSRNVALCLPAPRSVSFATFRLLSRRASARAANAAGEPAVWL
jgi:hypothetical protein